MSNLGIDDLWGLDLSGHDMDVLGGEAVRPVMIPVRGQRDNGCPCQADGLCPADCVECLVFEARMGTLPSRRAGTGHGEERNL